MGYNSDGVANASASDAPKKRGFLGENRNLWLVLGGLVAIAIVLVVGIVMVNVGGKTVAGEDVAVPEHMDDWDGSISDATKSYIFSNNIKEKLKNDATFTYDEAVLNYEDALMQSSGELKFNIAIEYAYFVCDEGEDVNKAVGIMASVENLLDLDDSYPNYYYTTMRNLYETAGDATKVQFYEKKIDEAIEKYGEKYGE